MKEILAKSLLNKIERLEAFEERLSVRFENISVKVDSYGWVHIFLELHSNAGTSISQRMQIECIAYDIEGLILETTWARVNENDFFGFEVLKFNFHEDDIAYKINKIRIYPKTY